MSHDAMIKERARRALSHGGGIDSILFALLAGAGVVAAVALLVFGFRTAEGNAERDVEHSQAAETRSSSEMGTN